MILLKRAGLGRADRESYEAAARQLGAEIADAYHTRITELHAAGRLTEDAADDVAAEIVAPRVLAFRRSLAGLGLSFNRAERIVQGVKRAHLARLDEHAAAAAEG